MNKHIIKSATILFSALVFWLLLSNPLQAQRYHTLYWMQGIPQSNYANPAMQPLPNYYVGLPGISSVFGSFSNTGFAPKDLLKKDPRGSLYIDDQSLINSLKSSNHLISDFNIGIISFGFRAKGKNYFSFNINERVENQIGYPKDLFRIAIEGNDAYMQNGTTAQFGALGLNFNHFREFGIGYSRRLTENLTLGVRAKAIQGMGNVSFARSNLGLFTGQDNYQILLNADLLVNTSLPFTLAPLDDLDPETAFDLQEEEIINYALNTENPGFAADFGAQYVINDKIFLSASITDLGFINWNSNVENFALNGNFEFKGLDLNDIFMGNDEEADDDPFDGFLDSIIDLFDREETTLKYQNPLATKVFLSAAYGFTPMHKVALLGRGEFFNGELYPSFTLSYNFQPINRFGSTFSYSIIHGNYHNVGFGMHVNIYPLQIYLVTDNFFWAMQPHTFQNFNFQVGVNIAAGFGKKEDTSAPSMRW